MNGYAIVKVAVLVPEIVIVPVIVIGIVTVTVKSKKKV